MRRRTRLARYVPRQSDRPSQLEGDEAGISPAGNSGISYRSAAATDDWNAVHVSVRGNTLAHMLNGRLMAVAIDDDAPNRPAGGLIGMQVHVGPPTKVEYRDIRLKTW
jgi:hypothetical protein